MRDDTRNELLRLLDRLEKAQRMQSAEQEGLGRAAALANSAEAAASARRARELAALGLAIIERAREALAEVRQP